MPAFTGATICITGTLSEPRSTIEKGIKALGGETSSSVTAKTTHVVANVAEYQSKTNKIIAAEGKGVPIVSEGWLDACKSKGKVVPHSPFILTKGAKGSQPKGKTAEAKVPKATGKRGRAEEEEPPAKKGRAAPKPASKKQKAVGGQPLAGMVIVITGTMSKVRRDMQALIEEHGGKCANSVTKAATHLLAIKSGDGSSKYMKATDSELPILREREVRRLCGLLDEDPEGENGCETSGHPMEWSKNAPGDYREGFCCNKCGKFSKAGTFRWVCFKCEDDVCGKCRPGPK